MSPGEEGAELTLTVGAPANGGSCVARHDGRVVFVRYALPGEVVRAHVTDERGSFWHAEAIEVLEPSGDRIDPLCPIAGVDGAGCCDLSFATPEATRRLKGDVVANQLERLGGHTWEGAAEEVGTTGATPAVIVVVPVDSPVRRRRRVEDPSRPLSRPPSRSDEPVRPASWVLIVCVRGAVERRPFVPAGMSRSV